MCYIVRIQHVKVLRKVTGTKYFIYIYVCVCVCVCVYI